MDRDALVLRNRKIAEAFHKMPPKHQIRYGLLRAVALLPISHGPSPKREKILLIRPDHLGDVLLTTPAIHALRHAAPAAEIHALVGPWSAGVLADNPDLDAVITLDFPGFNRSGNPNLGSPYQLAWTTARQLRKVGYSSAVILRPDHWWGALVAFLAGIPQRIGHHHRDTVPFLTDPIQITERHAVMQSVRLMAQWAGQIPTADLSYQFHYPDAATDFIEDYLTQHDINRGDRLFCIHPGAGTWVKRWTGRQWAEVADMLTDQLDAQAIITGTDSESHLAQEIAAYMTHQPIIATGDTDIPQLAALFDRALVVLGPDSGPLHLAAAVNAPTVALFGPADRAEFAPWGPAAHHHTLVGEIGCIACRVLDWGQDNPEHHPCVREISVGRVLEAARQVTAP